MLTTQNPVDLDYKAPISPETLVHCDSKPSGNKMRVLDGLEGAASQGMVRRSKWSKILATGPKGIPHEQCSRSRNHIPKPLGNVVFEGPLTRNRISQLTASTKMHEPAIQAPATGRASGPIRQGSLYTSGTAIPYAAPGTGIQRWHLGSAPRLRKSRLPNLCRLFCCPCPASVRYGFLPDSPRGSPVISL